MRVLCADNDRAAKLFWGTLQRMGCGFSVFHRKIINLRFADSHRPGGLEQINDKMFGAIVRRNREPGDIFLTGPIGKLIMRFRRDTGMKGIHTDRKQRLKRSLIG